MPEPRRYQLHSEAANRLILEIVDAIGVPPERRLWIQQMLTTVLKLHEDGASTGDLKITNATLKELRYAYKVFAPYRDVRKVTVFGSARTSPDEAAAAAAREFGRRMVDQGWMVVTGAGAGIMGAAQEGAASSAKTSSHHARMREFSPKISRDLPRGIHMGFLAGKKLLITGVLSNRSIAYGIAKACHEQGAELAFSYVGERFKDRITEFAADFGSKLVFDCDVGDDAQIDKLFADLAQAWPKFDGFVHSIGFAPREAIAGDFLEGLSREGFKVAHDKHGPAIDPDRGDRVASPGALADARAYLAKRFPALAGAPLNEERVCQYENSSNGDLLIDRHPTASNVLLVGAGSGHGFKHGPEVGRYAAELTTGKLKKVEPRFSLESKAEQQNRAVH